MAVELLRFVGSGRRGRALVLSDGGGRWRVYATRLDIADNGVGGEVRDRVLAEGITRCSRAPADR